jgi:hypothetical protein
MFKMSAKSGCTSTCVVSLESLSPTTLTSSAVKTLENTEEDPADPEPTGEGTIQMEDSCH